MLIVPNAESALNEEAGKLLLEHYDDYFQRAKMMTDIHAQVCIYLLIMYVYYSCLVSFTINNLFDNILAGIPLFDNNWKFLS